MGGVEYRNVYTCKRAHLHFRNDCLSGVGVYDLSNMCLVIARDVGIKVFGDEAVITSRYLLERGVYVFRTTPSALMGLFLVRVWCEVEPGDSRSTIHVWRESWTSLSSVDVDRLGLTF